MASNRVEPIRSFHFCIDIDGVREASFVYFSGAGAQIEAIPFRQGGLAQHVYQLPGQIRYTDVTLRYGVTRSSDLWQWFETGLRGEVERRNVSILMLDQNGQTESFRWNLFDAWISRWQASPLDAMANEIAIDEMTLVCERVERA